MYVGPKKFIESDFVTRMRLKYSTTSEDGTVILTPKAKIIAYAFGMTLSTAVSVTLYVVANRTIFSENDDHKTSTED